MSTEPIFIRAKYDGMIDTIYHAVGDSIDEKELLFQTSNVLVDRQIIEIEAQLISFDETYNRYVQESRSAIRQLHDLEIQSFKAVEKINNNLNKYVHKGSISDQEATDLRIKYLQKIKDVKKVEIDLHREINRVNHPHQLGINAEIISSLKQNLALIKAQQDSLRIFTVNSGKIVDILTREGEWVEKGQLLAKISQNKPPVVFAYTEPKWIDYVSEGKKANVILPNGKKIKARVTRPTELATEIPGHLSHPFAVNKPLLKVTLSLSENVQPFIEGLPVDVVFGIHYFIAL